MLESIPVTFDPINLKDFFLGAFMFLALRRGRIDNVLDRVLPTRE